MLWSCSCQTLTSFCLFPASAQEATRATWQSRPLNVFPWKHPPRSRLWLWLGGVNKPSGRRVPTSPVQTWVGTHSAQGLESALGTLV